MVNFVFDQNGNTATIANLGVKRMASDVLVILETLEAFRAEEIMTRGTLGDVQKVSVSSGLNV